MEMILIGSGAFVLLVGTVQFLVAAFEESILWAIACFAFWPLSIIFLATHWQKAKKPFFTQLAGAALIFVGMVLQQY